MAQANVAREPSMEEILASIRKIIESNDVTDEQAAAPETAVAEDDHSPAAEPAARPVSLLNRIPGDGAEAPTPKPREPSANEVRSEPLAPLRPGLDARTEKPSSIRPAEPAQTPLPQTPPAERRREAPARLADVAAAARSEPSGPPVEAADDESDVVFLSDSDLDIDADGKDGAGDPVEADGEIEPAQKEPRALISPAAGARVAASFGNLSQAVASGPSRSFDDIAEDMLRPMLQQWMDDNLPTLVERLVREEIERVARGR